MLIVNGTGRLGKDAELKQTAKGKILKFSIASNSLGAKDKRTTTWLDCVILNDKRATSLAGFFKKGVSLVFTGELKSNRYEDKDGNQRTTITCLFNQFEFGQGQKNSETQEVKQSAKQETVLVDDEVPF
tara:strand:- start:151 stop:537 length:387 start_codon:yes stop_codon:yes gene_type:complete